MSSGSSSSSSSSSVAAPAVVPYASCAADPISTARHAQLLIRSLKCCGKLTGAARQLHADAIHKGLLPTDHRITTSLVYTYFKCNAITEAQQAFQHLPSRDVVSWSALICGYAQHGLAHEAIRCFRLMEQESIAPDAITFVCILKACISMGSAALVLGEEIHAKAQKQGLLKENLMLGNVLVSMYAKCGMLENAQRVFDELPARDVISWNALITGHSQQMDVAQAFHCFRRMQDEGIPPDAVTALCILKSCASTGSLKLGEEIHVELCNRGFGVEQAGVLGTALMDMYAKCGLLDKAKQVFDNLPTRDVVSCNVLMDGYLQHGLMDDVLKCFRRMEDEDILPDRTTFLCALKACSSIRALEVGEEIHEKINMQRLLEKDIFIVTTLVDMYAKCGVLVKAQQVFDKLLVRDVVSWNVLIAGYVKCGHVDEALSFFQQMQDEGVSPDALTFALISKGCSTIGSLELGKVIHTKVYNLGVLEKDVILCTSLVDLYSNCSVLERAQEVFDELQVRDVVAWNALIAGYAEHDYGPEALTCFWQMQNEGICPDAITFTNVLQACGNMGSLGTGEEIHARISKDLLFEKDVMVGSTLVETYAKCGLLVKAQDVFNELPIRDVAAWNALIAGYAQIGQTKKVSYLFRRMVANQVMPDIFTFTALLNGCSHAGLVEEGHFVFNKMQSLYYLIPTLKQYICMVDLLCRAGHFSKAMLVVENIPSFEQLPLLLVFLGACKKWSNIELGKWAFEKSLKLDEKCDIAYVCMQNIYSLARMHADNG